MERNELKLVENKEIGIWETHDYYGNVTFKGTKEECIEEIRFDKTYQGICGNIPNFDPVKARLEEDVWKALIERMGRVV